MIFSSLYIFIYIYDMMGGIRFCGCGCQSEDPFVCFGIKPTQRACAPPDRKRTREERSQSRQEKEAEQRSWQNRGSQQSREERWMLEPVDSEAGLANMRGWVSIPGGFVGISLEYTLTLAHRCTESHAKVSQTSPFLHLELTQVRLFVLFSSTLSVVYVVLCCVSVKKCEIPLAGDERNH